MRQAISSYSKNGGQLKNKNNTQKKNCKSNIFFCLKFYFIFIMQRWLWWHKKKGGGNISRKEKEKKNW